MKMTFSPTVPDLVRAVTLSDVRSDEIRTGTSLTRAASYSWGEALAFDLVEYMIAAGSRFVTVTVQ